MVISQVDRFWFGTVGLVFLGLGATADPTYAILDEPREVKGVGEVLDGDTLKINNKTIHLYGVDAPDIEQKCRIYRLNWPCGERAAIKLTLLINKKPVRCEVVAQPTVKTPQPVQAHCFNYENLNLNSAIIGAGMAIPLTSETHRYVTAGRYAQIKRLGLWSGRFIRPDEWRDGKRFRPLGKPFKRDALKE